MAERTRMAGPPEDLESHRSCPPEHCAGRKALDAIEKLERSHAALLAAAKALVGRIEDGTLVRDITKDASPDWSIRMLKFVQELQQAQAAIAAAEEGNE
jgi:hypothetical protein